jgi:hypothetical protein
MTELATFAKNWLPPSTIHNIYAAEKTTVQMALNRNMINLMNISKVSNSVNPPTRPQKRVETHSEWYRGVGHVLCSFPAPIKNAVNPNSAIADNVINVNKKGW